MAEPNDATVSSGSSGLAGFIPLSPSGRVWSVSHRSPNEGLGADSSRAEFDSISIPLNHWRGLPFSRGARKGKPSMSVTHHHRPRCLPRSLSWRRRRPLSLRRQSQGCAPIFLSLLVEETLRCVVLADYYNTPPIARSSGIPSKPPAHPRYSQQTFGRHGEPGGF